ncbi:hypothetical protein AAII07_40505 [Microvirga sp. 0TCS3.31]
MKGETLLYIDRGGRATGKCGGYMMQIARPLMFILLLLPAGLGGILGAIFGFMLSYPLIPFVGFFFFFLFDEGRAIFLTIVSGPAIGFIGGFAHTYKLLLRRSLPRLAHVPSEAGARDLT